MVCPFCTQDTEVINSRPQKRTNSVWRRRHCTACGRIFTSIEKADLGKSVRVKKRAGVLQPFSEAKLLVSLYKALEHHKNAAEVASELSNGITASLMRFTNGPVIPSTAIAHQVIVVLKRFDAAAAIRYKSYQNPMPSKRDVQRSLR